MGLLGSTGLVTRGFGKDHKILTRGFGADLDLGGITPLVKRSSYDFNIFTQISKEIFLARRIYCPFEMRRNLELLINSAVFKEVEGDLNLKINLNYKRLSDALDLV